MGGSRGLLTGTLVTAGAGVLCGAVALAFSAADQGSSTVRVGIPSPHQADVLATGRLRVRLRAAVGGPVTIAARLVRSSGYSVSLGTTALRMHAGQRRPVAIPLSRTGATAVARCEPGLLRVSAWVAHNGGPGIVTRHLRTDPPYCGRFFPRSAIWSNPLAGDAPLDPDSPAVTADLLRHVNRDRYPPTINTAQYTPPVYAVPAAQPRVRVVLDQAPGTSDALAAAFRSVPLPPFARPSAGSDGELVVWQPATDKLWEFWQLRRAVDGWHARWGGRLTHATASPGVFTKPHANWGASATSLALVGGLITPQELRRRRIDHALALGVPLTRRNAFSLPAQRTDGASRCPHSVPEGARFRLDPRLDIRSMRLPPPVATLARAVQRYGMVVRDQSGAVAFYAQNADSLPSDPYPALFGGRSAADLLRSFPWGHLQLVRMRLVESSGGGPLLPPPGGFLGGCQ